jgi:hypothetical protein
MVDGAAGTGCTVLPRDPLPLRRLTSRAPDASRTWSVAHLSILLPIDQEVPRMFNESDFGSANGVSRFFDPGTGFCSKTPTLAAQESGEKLNFGLSAMMTCDNFESRLLKNQTGSNIRCPQC